MTQRLWGFLAAGALLSGCATVHPPVPVLGDPVPLAGVWEGSYESEDTGRAGALYFALTAAGDSAVGEIVMLGRQTPVSVRRDGSQWTWDGPTRSQVLPIRFVRVGRAAGDDMVEVAGELAPYQDPDCGCGLRTTFRGWIEDDVATGTFTTLAEDAYHSATGTWAARRRHEGAGRNPVTDQ